MSYKLSLTAAILSSLNVMIGTGLFVNTSLLAQNADGYGALVYALVGILLIPLILTFARLLKIHDGGTFYEFSATLHPVAGFVASFSYFVAKLASCALGIHVFVTFMRQAFPFLNPIPTLMLDCSIITLFALLNLFNIQTGQKIQYGFLLLKFMPITFAVVGGLYLFKGVPFSVEQMPLGGLVGSVPFVLFAFTGFEVCCSLSRHIEDSQRNAPRALIIAYTIGVCIVVLYQLMFYGALGHALGELGSYARVFPALFDLIAPYASSAKTFFSALLAIGIASSSLGAAYGIMYSNMWNLFRLAQHDAVPGSQTLLRVNKNHVPYFIVLIEGLMAITYTLLTRGNQVPLQQINSFGMTTMYTLCALALVVYEWQNHKKIGWMPLLALTSCSLFIASFVRNTALYSAMPIVIFISIIVLATIVFLVRSNKAQFINEV